MSPEKRESAIYFPPEGEDKKSAKHEEKNARRESEQRLHAVTEEEAQAAAAEAEEISKKSKGKIGLIQMAYELRKWWKGKGEEDGAKYKAEKIFDVITHHIAFTQLHEQEKWKGINQFTLPKDIESMLKQFAQEVIERGTQEHVLNYFEKEWAHNHHEEDIQMVWQVYQKYLNETAEEMKKVHDLLSK